MIKIVPTQVKVMTTHDTYNFEKVLNETLNNYHITLIDIIYIGGNLVVVVYKDDRITVEEER